jgi:hypothetical protein
VASNRINRLLMPTGFKKTSALELLLFSLFGVLCPCIADATVLPVVSLDAESCQIQNWTIIGPFDCTTEDEAFNRDALLGADLSETSGKIDAFAKYSESVSGPHFPRAVQASKVAMINLRFLLDSYTQADPSAGHSLGVTMELKSSSMGVWCSPDLFNATSINLMIVSP